MSERASTTTDPRTSIWDLHRPGNTCVSLASRVPPWQRFLRATGHLLATYETALLDAGSPIATDPEALRTCREHAEAAVALCAQSLRHGRPVITERPTRPRSLSIGPRRATRIHPGESIRAAILLVDILTEQVRAVVHDRRDAGDLLTAAVITLNHAIGGRLREETIAHDQFLHDQIKVAQTDHTRTIAREIHDHLGNGMSLAYRHLEMYEALAGRGDATAAVHDYVVRARDVLADTLDSARRLISGLRVRHPRTALREAVEIFLDTAGLDDVDITIVVLGDEQRLTEDISGELFTIIREALRNTLKHAGATTVSITVSITGSAVTAEVVDDGAGFDTGHPGGGHGLISMTERAQLLGGGLHVLSDPGTGTRITVHVPLDGDER